jgi:hypothetical protein
VLKFLLLSILLATFLIPAAAARVTQPRRAMVTMLIAMAVFEVGYAVFLLIIYPRFV